MMDKVVLYDFLFKIKMKTCSYAGNVASKITAMAKDVAVITREIICIY